MKRLLLGLLLSATALACSEKPEVKPDPVPLPSGGPGSLAATAAPAESPVIDRSPLRVTESPEKLVFAPAVRLSQELLDDRTLGWIDENRQLVLHPLRDRMVVSYAGYVAVLDDHRLELAQHVWPQEAYEFTAIVGDWPNAVVAQAEFDSWASPGYQRQAPIRRTEHYRLSASDWQPLAEGAGTKAAAWRDGSILALKEQALTVVGGAKPPQQAPPRDADRCKESRSEVVPEALDALPGGDAFVIGKRCGHGAYAVERWPNGQAESVIDDLPGAPATAKRAFLSAGSRDRAHAVLSTGENVYAARWDGQAFRAIELRAEGDVRAVWTAADGTLFFVLQPRSAAAKTAKADKGGKAELVRLTASGEVARSAVFAVSPSAKIWAADAQTAYVASYASILSTKPGLVFVKGKGQPSTSADPPPSALPPYKEGCPTPFVFLYDVSTKSPPGFDFPSTRKALSTFARVADISLVEFVHASKRRLGVRVPSADVGNEVIAHVVANMKDERPELVCLDPKEELRVIPIR